MKKAFHILYQNPHKALIIWKSLAVLTELSNKFTTCLSNEVTLSNKQEWQTRTEKGNSVGIKLSFISDLSSNTNLQIIFFRFLFEGQGSKFNALTFRNYKAP